MHSHLDAVPSIAKSHLEEDAGSDLAHAEDASDNGLDPETAVTYRAIQDCALRELYKGLPELR